MSSVQSRRTAVHDVLFNRPYLRSDLIRLAAYLCEEGYSTMARNRVIDAVADGTPLEELVRREELEPADLAQAEHYLAIGQRVNARRPRRSVGSIGDLARLFTTALRSAGIEPRLSGAALEVTIGGRRVQIALVPSVSGGSPEAIHPAPPELTEAEEMELIDAWDREAAADYGHYLESLSDEQVEALAAEASDQAAAELPEDFELRPISGGAPVPDADGSIHEAGQVEAMRAWYRRNPIAELNAVRVD